MSRNEVDVQEVTSVPQPPKEEGQQLPLFAPDAG